MDFGYALLNTRLFPTLQKLPLYSNFVTPLWIFSQAQGRRTGGQLRPKKKHDPLFKIDPHYRYNPKEEDLYCLFFRVGQYKSSTNTKLLAFGEPTLLSS